MGVKEQRERPTGLQRQEILDAARDILVREGYDGLSMRKIAEQIKYSPTAIYLHFRDRDDLVFCVCEESLARLVHELQDVAERNRDPLVALKKGLRRYVDFGLKHPQHYQATFMVWHGTDARKAARYMDPSTHGMRALAVVQHVVEECVRQKKLAKADVHSTSCSLWAGIHGITSLLIVMPNFEWKDRDKVVDRLISMMIDGLLP